MGRWAVGGAVLVGLAVVLGLLLPIFSPYDINQSVAPTLQSPSWAHPFGTDQLGRDLFTRTFAAARADFLLALGGVAVPFAVGTAIGGAAGAMANRYVDTAIQLVMESIIAFPFLVLAIAVLAAVGPGAFGVLLAIWLSTWARYARLARARGVALRNAGYIQAARVLGYGRVRVLVRHVFPNVYDETLAYALSDFVIVILVIAGLSYLGLGIQPPAPEWGAMIADGQVYLRSHWWLSIAPGATLAATSVGVSLLAQGYSEWRSGR